MTSAEKAEVVARMSRELRALEKGTDGTRTPFLVDEAVQWLGNLIAHYDVLAAGERRGE